MSKVLVKGGSGLESAELGKVPKRYKLLAVEKVKSKFGEGDRARLTVIIPGKTGDKFKRAIYTDAANRKVLAKYVGKELLFSRDSERSSVTIRTAKS